MLSNMFRHFAMESDVLGKITSTTILQHQKNPISSLQRSHKKSSKVHTFINKTQKEDESKPNLDGFVESDDVGMIDGSEDRNLLEETVSDFRVKLLLINLLDCDF